MRRTELVAVALQPLHPARRVQRPGDRGDLPWTAVDGAGWDPADPSSGNAWENQALFDFTGKLLPAARNLSPHSKG